MHGAHQFDKQQYKYGLLAEIDVFATDDGAATSLGTWSDPRWYSTPYTAQAISPAPGYDRGIIYTYSEKNKETDVQYYARHGNIVLTIDAFIAGVARAAVAPVLRSRLESFARTALTYATRQAAVALTAHPRPLAPVVYDGDDTKWQMTLLHTYRTNVIGTTIAQGKFLVAVLKVQNVGNVPESFMMDTTLTALDAGGRTFSEDTDVESDAASQYNVSADSFDDVQPTFVTTIVVVFDVAKDASGVDLMFDKAIDPDNNSQPLFPLGV